MTSLDTMWADAGVKTYREHRCSSRHRTFNRLARCMWPRAAWVHGEGEWACVSRCRWFTVTLWPTREQAEAARRLIDDDACGGLCRKRHEIVRLALS